MSVYDEYTPPESGSGLYLKFEDGKSYKVQLATEPAVFADMYNRGGEKQISTKYGWVIWNYVEKRAQILVLPVTAFKMIMDLARNPDWGDPTQYGLTVKREGTGLETKYSVVPSPTKVALSTEAQKATDAVELLDELAKAPSRHSIAWLKDVAGGKKPDPSRVDFKDLDVNEPSEQLDQPEPVHDDDIDLSEIPF